MKNIIQKIFGVKPDAATLKYIKEKMRQAAVKKTAREVLLCGVNHVEIQNGLFLEFGVYSGDTINFISENIDKEIFGFDSFEGLPEFWRKGYDKGMFRRDAPPAVNKNVTLIKGLFSDALPGFMDLQDGVISFMHVDCDLYSSTKTIFDLLGDRIVRGTVIVFDEYFNYPGWENGEFKAFKEFAAGKNIRYEYLCYNKNHQQVAVKISGVF